MSLLSSQHFALIAVYEDFKNGTFFFHVDNIGLCHVDSLPLMISDISQMA